MSGRYIRLASGDFFFFNTTDFKLEEVAMLAILE